MSIKGLEPLANDLKGRCSTIKLYTPNKNIDEPSSNGFESKKI